jgi:hypothetical protein
MDRAIVLDASTALGWMCVNLLLGLFADKLVRVIHISTHFAERIMLGLIVAFSVILSSSIILGGLGMLSGHSLLLMACGFSFGGLCLLSWHSIDTARLSPGPAVHTNKSLEWSATSWIWLCLSVLLISHMVIEGVLKFPDDWDCLMYHIPMIDEWLQARRLYAPQSSYWWQPGISELIGLWIVAPYSGDFLIGLNNLPTIVLWTAACWSIAVTLGQTSFWANLTTIAVLAIHTTIHESDDASNDLAVVAFWTSALASALRYCKSDRISDAVFCGLSLGLLVGVKYFALGYAGVLWIGVLAATVLRRGVSRAVKPHLILTISALAIGGYWYLRNFLVSGSPVFPLGWTGATSDLRYPSVWETTFIGNPNSAKYSIGITILWQFAGPLYVASLMYAPVACSYLTFDTWKALRTGESSRAAAFPILLATALVGSFLIWIATPMLVEDEPGTLNHLRMGYTPVRFGLCFLSLALILMFRAITSIAEVLLSNISGPIRTSYLGLQVGAGILVAVQWYSQLSIVWNEYHFFESFSLASAIIALGTLVYLAGSSYFQMTRQHIRICCVAGFAIALTIVTTFQSRRWHAGFDQHYQQLYGTSAFRILTVDFPRATNVCVLDLRIYPFFGSARQRHIWRPRDVQSTSQLSEYCRQHQIELVVVHNPTRRAWDLFDRLSEEMQSPQLEFVYIATTVNYQLFRVAQNDK